MEQLVIDIEDILSSARSSMGAEAAHILSSGGCINVETIKSYIPSLDVALGTGGWPKGRIVEILGNEASGKTTIGLHAIASAQRNGGCGAIVDAEHSIDPSWAESIGVDNDKVIISQPDSGEEGLELCELYAREGVDVIMVDSVAALTPKVELEGEMGDAHVGLQARLMGQAMRKLRGVIRRSKSLVIFTNQIRFKIGVRFGNPETTPGGQALRFYSSVRLQTTGLSPKDDDKDGDKIISKTIKMKVIKNKLAPPYKVALAKIGFENGFDLSKNLFEGLLDTNVIEKSGNTYFLNDEKLAVGKKKAMEALNDLESEKLDELYDDLVLSFNDDYLDLVERKKQLEKLIENGKEGKKEELADIVAQINRIRS